MGRYLASKRYKTRRYNRDLDQILHDDLSSAKSIDALQHQSMDEYKPGLGQYYCVPCARYCESSHALVAHEKSKVHKRRLRALKYGAYTKEEADFAAGRDVEKYFKKMQQQQEIRTQSTVADMLDPPAKVLAKEVPKEMEVDELVEEKETAPVEDEIDV